MSEYTDINGVTTHKIIECREFEINIDNSIEEQMKEVYEYCKDNINTIKTEIEKMYNMFVPYVADWAIYILTYLFKNKILYLEEIDYYCKIFNMSRHKMLVIQLCYEVFSACSTFTTNINDKTVMIRTMDWDLPCLKGSTYQMKAYKDGEYIYTATRFFGSVGIFTALTQNKIAVALNYRRTQDINIKSILSNMYKTLKLYYPSSYLIRQVCEMNATFSLFVRYIKETHLISPCYISISTPFTSMVITRDAELGFDEYNSKYFIQCNCDRDKTEPNILWSNERKEIITNTIKKNNNNFDSIETLIKSFAIEPVLNFETIHVNVITNEDSEYKTFLYYGNKHTFIDEKYLHARK